MKPLTFIIVLSLIAGAAIASGPPEYTNQLTGQTFAEGWGNCPINWETATGSYDSGLCLYAGGNFHQFYLVGDQWESQIIQYDPITLDLWIELSMVCTYQYTDYDWHRVNALTGAETINFYISGTVRSNETLRVSLDKLSQDLDKLHFIEAPFGSAGDIPIAWQCRMGNGLSIGSNVTHDWATCTPNGNGDLVLNWNVAPCNHWFQWWGSFLLIEHQADGHYQLVIAGCPVPTT